MSDEKRSYFRRMEDEALLPNEGQRKHIEYIMSLPPDEQRRVELFMGIHTRDTLFNHMFEEGQAVVEIRAKVDQMHAAIYGKKDDPDNRGALKVLDDFTKTLTRINTWLDGACWILKTALPWAVGLAVSIGGLGKLTGAW